MFDLSVNQSLNSGSHQEKDDWSIFFSDPMSKTQSSIPNGSHPTDDNHTHTPGLYVLDCVVGDAFQVELGTMDALKVTRAP